eukprot:scaffold103735_cov29-Attheya_sp.AAC.1
MSDNTFTSPTMIRLDEKEHRGKVIVAVSNFDPGVSGLELLAEKALLASYWCYKIQSDEVKAKVQDFYVELDCAKAQTVHDIVAPIAVREKVDVNEFVRISMVCIFNDVRVNPAAAGGQGAGKNFGTGLFEIACRMSNSWKPNCCWISSQDGTKELVRLIDPVDEGEELTIDYCAANLLLPSYLRRKALLESIFLFVIVSAVVTKTTMKRGVSNAPRINVTGFTLFTGPTTILNRWLNKRTGEQGCCALCGAASNRKCTCCGEVFYCSREHEQKNWPMIHKKKCKPKV